MSAASIPQKPRSMWPIAIAVYFAMALLGIAVFVTWAVRQNMDLVRKDYYAEEIQFQQHLDQVNHARQLRWKPQIAYDSARDMVTVSIEKDSSATVGNLQFYRPSDAALDRTIKLSLDNDRSQDIDARAFPKGLWKVRISWTSDAKDFFSEETIVIDRS
ncbi:MAG: FixH family protein [Verrucomicrobiales bacterium]|nr:FixH family protein [Verrucomicrobiales bacterium]